MNRKNIIILSVTLVSATCSSQDESWGDKLDAPVAAEVSASIGESDTRATGHKWDSTDAIGISCGSNYQNVRYNVTDATLGTFEPASGNGIFFDTSGDVTFTAYYPFEGTSGTARSITLNTAEQSNSKSFDYLWAQTKTNYKKPSVKFNFTHAMTCLILQLKTDDSAGFDASDVTSGNYKISGIKHEGTFNTSTGTATATGSATADWSISATPKTSSNILTYSMILIPQTSKLKLTATIGGNDYACEFEPELKNGISYTYTITVKKTGLEVSTCNIADWSTGTTTATGTATYIDPFNGHPAVLMREASGTPGTTDYVPALYYADRNIGADKPEDIGAYFWWGDVVGYIPDQYISGDVTFTPMDGGSSTISFSSSNSNILTNNKSIDDLKDGWVDKESPYNLLPSKDAASVKWGGNWRMPTADDRFWLFNNPDKSSINWSTEINSGYQYFSGDNTILVRVTASASTPITWSNFTSDALSGDATTTLYTNGSIQVIRGVYVKSKSTGGVVFLPMGGNASGSKLLRIDTYLTYWTSTPYQNTEDAYYIVCQNNSLSPQSRTGRYMGLPIRPVMNK